MKDEDKLKALITIILALCFIFFVSYQKKKLEFQREIDRVNTLVKAIDELSKVNDSLIGLIDNRLIKHQCER